MNLPPKTKDIIDNYMYLVNDRNAPEDVMVLALYMQVARFLCWNRVKLADGQFPMIYAFNFSPSGSYKDRVIETLADLIREPLRKQHEMKDRKLDEMNKNFTTLLEMMRGEAKKEFITDKKPIRFSNTFKRGTVQALQKYRKGAENAGLGHVHYETSEFIDGYSVKDSNVDELLSMAKDAWNRGDSAACSVAGEWREHVEGVPFTFLLHGSSGGLKNNPLTLRRFMSILETGIAKRAFVLFNSDYKRVNREDDTIFEDETFAAANYARFADYFNRLYEAVKIENGIKKTIKMSFGARKLMNRYKNECNTKSETVKNEIIQIEMRDRFWRAQRLSASIAIFEHYDNFTIEESDYSFALYLAERWGQQFREFIERDEVLNIDGLWDYILENPHVSKSSIRKKLRSENTRRLDEALEQIKLKADEENMFLLVEEGRGLARYYTILPASKEEEAEILEYIRENGKTSCLTLNVLTAKFGKTVLAILKEKNIKHRDDGGYYIS